MMGSAAQISYEVRRSAQYSQGFVYVIRRLPHAGGGALCRAAKILNVASLFMIFFNENRVLFCAPQFSEKALNYIESLKFIY